MKPTVAVLLLALTSCATPYQEMGFTGGVRATRITADTFQIAGRGNAYTGADTIQRYVLRKAAETTLAAGYQSFMLGETADRARHMSFVSGSVSGGRYNGFGTTLIKPGETVLVKMLKGPPPADAPANVFDAAEVLKYMTPEKTPGG